MLQLYKNNNKRNHFMQAPSRSLSISCSILPVGILVAEPYIADAIDTSTF